MSKAKEGAADLQRALQGWELYLGSVPDNRCPGVSQLVPARSFVIVYEEEIIL